jgi:hypothetical protein
MSGWETVEAETLQLPVPPIPMPGDQVLWYLDAQRWTGELTGHNNKCQPVIRSMFDTETVAFSFGQIRLANAERRLGPNWQRLPPGGSILRATSEEISRFDEILCQHIPPGPKYFDLITEIWQRGFEVYLVGGTVRDVIGGTASYDVDLVTTMPLHLARPLLRSMYRDKPDIDPNNGFIRIGGAPGSGDPFIDLKNFVILQPGTPLARFGSRFDMDMAHRDFACNSVYYDPVNHVYVDPSGRGVADAKTRELFVVCDPRLKSDYQLATIAIRFCKFCCRHFTFSEQTRLTLCQYFFPKLSGMHSTRRQIYLRAQMLSKHPKHEHPRLLDEFRAQMFAFGFEELWRTLFEPIYGELLA